MWKYVENLLSFVETKTFRISWKRNTVEMWSIYVYAKRVQFMLLKIVKIDEYKLKWTTKFIKAIVIPENWVVEWWSERVEWTNEVQKIWAECDCRRGTSIIVIIH